jgi:hypothetical protein
VYVTVYSDGPTRVLRLSDEPNVTSTEAEQSVLDLAARLKQVKAGARDYQQLGCILCTTSAS